MAREEQLEAGDTDSRKVILSAADAEFIASQLSMSVQRARDGQRLGTHLLKRMRRSKAILLNAIEHPYYMDVRDVPKKLPWWKKLLKIK